MGEMGHHTTHPVRCDLSYPSSTDIHYHNGYPLISTLILTVEHPHSDAGQIRLYF